MVEDFFRESGLFEPTNTFRSMGLPRPSDDKYAEYGMPSDPIYAVYAEKKGGDPDRKARPGVKPMYGERFEHGRAGMQNDPRSRMIIAAPTAEKK